MSHVRTILWNTFGQFIFANTPHNAYKFRTRLLKLFGMKCGNRVRFRRSVWVDQPWNVEADDLAIFGDYAIVNATEPILVGKRCVVSQFTMLITAAGDCEHNVNEKRRGPITIEDDCWVAADSVVLPNSHIESGVVVGARGLVDGRLPQWTICTGEPAAVRTERSLYGTN